MMARRLLRRLMTHKQMAHRLFRACKKTGTGRVPKLKSGTCANRLITHKQMAHKLFRPFRQLRKKTFRLPRKLATPVGKRRRRNPIVRRL